MQERVSIYQVNPVSNFPLDNFAVIERAVREASEGGSSLCVLPEDCLLGVVRGNQPLLEAGSRFDEWVVRLSRLAKMHSIDLVPGSLPKTVGESVYNTTLYINSHGVVVSEYSKNNLWLSERDEYDQSTMEPVVFDGVLGRTALLICWDIMDHTLFESVVRKGVEWIIIPSFWVNAQAQSLQKKRGKAKGVYRDFIEGHMLDSLIATRAQEYNVGIVFCNFGGTKPYVDIFGQAVKARSAGKSQIIAPLGGLNSRLNTSGVGHLDVEINRGYIRTVLNDHEVLYGRREDVSSGQQYIVKNEGQIAHI